MDPSQPPPTEPDSTLAGRLGRWWRSLNGPMRAIAIVALTVGILVLGLALYRSLNLQEDQSQPSDTAQVTLPAAEVSITKEGLNPATITVDAGTQLTWTNNDDEPHQVSANPHPLHDSIEGFDSDNVLQPGDSQSFTFETPGSFSVHDHLDPLEDAYHGVVIVE